MTNSEKFHTYTNIVWMKNVHTTAIQKRTELNKNMLKKMYDSVYPVDLVLTEENYL